jgi:hypothetical protein
VDTGVVKTPAGEVLNEHQSGLSQNSFARLNATYPNSPSAISIPGKGNQFEHNDMGLFLLGLSPFT